MKTRIIIITLVLIHYNYTFGQTVEIDSCRLYPGIEIIENTDEIEFIAYTALLCGGCVYHSDIDSIINNTFYINGKFNSTIKCLADIEDHHNLGHLPAGEYKIVFSFIDTNSFNVLVTDVDSILFTVSSNTEISNLFLDEKIKLYPNPTKDKVYIEKENITKINLYSFSGKLLEEFQPEKRSINISKYKQGLYLLEIKGKNWVNRDIIVKN